ncbi:Regulator of sigma-E protease RseP [Roseovarius litorisediminis]|uniref:Zinc metalloprotease n=1 Tax=Roseovarius litorisediminis TaxID=1312363 RepID=A0A1Y5R9A3_9RHOB|nr:RIP metalloprotease RseP [Roseovarius litorisediminis]SLN12081.1 Regulator of sigma-E protease RseP [Roseovarius litorisediminis]
MDITSLLPQFGGFFSTMLAFVVALSVIVAIHEYGHYIVGRWSGIKAEVFSLGFGPVIWSRVDRRGTRWQFALLPFGGYVKFLGDANAASAKSARVMEETPPELLRQTMHGAPLWARTATVLAGPVFNFILSILVFGAVMMSQGKTVDPLTVGTLKPSPVQGITLQPGDALLRVAGVDVPSIENGDSFDEFTDQLPTDALLDYEVLRDGQPVVAKGPYPLPPVVVGLAPQSAAYDIDMQPGDVITSVDGQEISSFSELKDVVETSNGRVLALKVWRDGEIIDFALAPRRVDEPQPEGGFKASWRIGISGGLAFEPSTETLGVGAALIGGVKQTARVIETSFSGLFHMITGAISSCNMSGPIGIAQVSGAMASQGAGSFITFIAFLSAAVGLLNLFPIPVLDGGHLVFYAYEAVAGKPPSDTALRVLMTAGLVLILGLMVFALGNDLFCP